MPIPVVFEPAIAEEFLRYAGLVARRGYIHNTLGNMALRAPHPDFEHGVAYTKHAEISLEEMGAENLVITDIPSSRLLHGERITSVGHNLNREILRLRPDINAVIHVHDDATIAFFASGGFSEVGVLSLDMPFILGKWPYYVDAHMDVEDDVGPVAGFIQDTNTVVLLPWRDLARPDPVRGLSPAEFLHLRDPPEHPGRAAGGDQGHPAPLPIPRGGRGNAPPGGADHLPGPGRGRDDGWRGLERNLRPANRHPFTINRDQSAAKQ